MSLTNPFGTILNPTSYFSEQGSGFFTFLTNIFKLAATIGGLYLVVQLIMAGFQYLSANGDVKKTEQAWNQIWQSILGLVIISVAFIIAGIIGRVTNINILNPTIYGPGN
ncbi:MAG: hypothetical protein WC784_01485 [Candidatus Shapirobacteria bacterium]|jgi:hypothetical protein